MEILTAEIALLASLSGSALKDSFLPSFSLPASDGQRCRSHAELSSSSFLPLQSADGTDDADFLLLFLRICCEGALWPAGKQLPSLLYVAQLMQLFSFPLPGTQTGVWQSQKSPPPFFFPSFFLEIYDVAADPVFFLPPCSPASHELSRELPTQCRGLPCFPHSPLLKITVEKSSLPSAD